MKRGECSRRIRGRSNRHYCTSIRGLRLPTSDEGHTNLHDKHQRAFKSPSVDNHGLLRNGVLETHFQRAVFAPAAHDGHKLQIDFLASQQDGDLTFRYSVVALFECTWATYLDRDHSHAHSVPRPIIKHSLSLLPAYHRGENHDEFISNTKSVNKCYESQRIITPKTDSVSKKRWCVGQCLSCPFSEFSNILSLVLSPRLEWHPRDHGRLQHVSEHLPCIALAGHVNQAHTLDALVRVFVQACFFSLRWQDENS